MSKIKIKINHENLPFSRENILNTLMSKEEIEKAISRFGDELAFLSGDNSLEVVKCSEPVNDMETVYLITSSLEEEYLLKNIEQTMISLKLGGLILK